VETEEQCPEVDLPKCFVEHAAGHLWPPEVEATKHRKDHCSEENVMEVGNYEVAS